MIEIILAGLAVSAAGHVYIGYTTHCWADIAFGLICLVFFAITYIVAKENGEMLSDLCEKYDQNQK